eukprot:5967519-Amphidinium_carterae.1
MQWPLSTPCYPLWWVEPERLTCRLRAHAFFSRSFQWRALSIITHSSSGREVHDIEDCGTLTVQ